MEENILISYLNDFIFCPASIYFHKLYGSVDKDIYQSTYQVNGLNAHRTIDNATYSSRKNVLQGISIYSDQYKIMGKIDVFNIETGELTERKKQVKKIYDGYIFQVYAQYYGLTELGYEVKKIIIHSLDDNKNYFIKLPSEDNEMKEKFDKLIYDIHNFNIENFIQTNTKKCANCIYEPSCDRSLYVNKA